MVALHQPQVATLGWLVGDSTELYWRIKQMVSYITYARCLLLVSSDSGVSHCRG